MCCQNWQEMVIERQTHFSKSLPIIWAFLLLAYSNPEAWGFFLWNTVASPTCQWRKVAASHFHQHYRQHPVWCRIYHTSFHSFAEWLNRDQLEHYCRISLKFPRENQMVTMQIDLFHQNWSDLLDNILWGLHKLGFFQLQTVIDTQWQPTGTEWQLQKTTGQSGVCNVNTQWNTYKHIWYLRIDRPNFSSEWLRASCN